MSFVSGQYAASSCSETTLPIFDGGALANSISIGKGLSGAISDLVRIQLRLILIYLEFTGQPYF